MFLSDKNDFPVASISCFKFPSYGRGVHCYIGRNFKFLFPLSGDQSYMECFDDSINSYL